MALKSISSADPNFVPNYQLSAIPYVTSSAESEVKHDATIKISFPFVTKYVKINNTGDAPLRVSFSQFGVTGSLGTSSANFFIIPTAAAGDVCIQDFDVRCNELYFRAEGSATDTDFSVFAGLTPIPSSSFPSMHLGTGFQGV